MKNYLHNFIRTLIRIIRIIKINDGIKAGVAFLGIMGMCVSAFAQNPNMNSVAMKYIELQPSQIIIGNLSPSENKVDKLPQDTFKLSGELNLDDFFANIKGNLNQEVATRSIGQVTSKKDVLFFVHGMGESKAKSFHTDYQYLKKLYLDNPASNVGAVVMVTWNASPSFYKPAQKNAKKVLPAFESLLFELKAQKQMQPELSINVLAHSLGSFILFNSLDAKLTAAPIFENIILSAPDIAIPSDDNQFKYDALSRIALRVWVMYHQKDRALWYSGIANGKKRLGRIGYNKTKNTHPNIKAIDVTEYKIDDSAKGKWNKHIYFRTSPKVMEMLVRILKK